MLRSKRSAGAFFAGASVLAGVLHYFYQVSAAKDLSQVAFGELSSWLAYVSVLLSVGVFFQFLSNFFPISGERCKRLLGFIIGVFFLALFLPFLYPTASKFTIALVAVILGPVYSWLFGQAQIRQFFYSMGVAAIALGAAKLSFGVLSVPGVGETLRYYWAIAVSFCPSSLFVAAVLYTDRSDSLQSRVLRPSGPKQVWNDLGSSLALSVLAALIPSMDIMIMDWSQDSETLGAYSRISLMYRGVFFGLFIFSQWLLPQQLSGESNPFHNLVFGWIKSLLFVIGLSGGVGLAAYLIAPIAASWLLGFEIKQYAVWIFFSCYNITILKSAFLKTQELSSLNQPFKGYVFVLLLILELVLFSFMKSLDVSFYLASVSFSHTLFLVFLFVPLEVFRFQRFKS